MRRLVKGVIVIGWALAALAGVVWLGPQDTPAQSTGLVVLSSNGVKPAVEGLVPQLERSTGQRVTVQFGSSKPLNEKIQAGEPFDVAILTSDNIDDLIRQGKIAPDTRSEFARTGIGVGIRAGAAKPDIATPEALKRTLLNAKSITLNPTGASATYVHAMLERMGIAENVKGKLILDAGSGQPQRNVAEGRAELVFTLIPEIVFFPGVELAGPLPATFQNYISFAAGVATNSRKAEAAKALVRFLTSPAAEPILRAKGLEPR